MTDSRPRNDAAMAEILASIRRIVADEDRRGAHAAPFDVQGDVLILTREMRIDDTAEDDGAKSPPVMGDTPSNELAPSAAAPEAELSVDEAAVVDIARIVLRDEFDGEFGRNLTAQITHLVREEVARALAEQDRARE